MKGKLEATKKLEKQKQWREKNEAVWKLTWTPRECVSKDIRYALRLGSPREKQWNKPVFPVQTKAWGYCKPPNSIRFYSESDSCTACQSGRRNLVIAHHISKECLIGHYLRKGLFKTEKRITAKQFHFKVPNVICPQWLDDRQTQKTVTEMMQKKTCTPLEL